VLEPRNGPPPSTSSSRSTPLLTRSSPATTGAPGIMAWYGSSMPPSSMSRGVSSPAWPEPRYLATRRYRFRQRSIIVADRTIVVGSMNSMPSSARSARVSPSTLPLSSIAQPHCSQRSLIWRTWSIAISRFGWRCSNWSMPSTTTQGLRQRAAAASIAASRASMSNSPEVSEPGRGRASTSVQASDRFSAGPQPNESALRRTWAGVSSKVTKTPPSPASTAPARICRPSTVLPAPD